jgi:hypothetical protein
MHPADEIRALIDAMRAAMDRHPSGFAMSASWIPSADTMFVVVPGRIRTVAIPGELFRGRDIEAIVSRCRRASEAAGESGSPPGPAEERAEIADTRERLAARAAS